MDNKKIISQLESIDDTLASFEDFLHGKDGDKCTDSRKSISDILSYFKSEESINLKELLQSGILNTAMIAREIWPVPPEKSTSEDAIKKFNKSSAIRLNQKLNEIRGQRLTEDDETKIISYLADNHRIILK